MPPTAPACVGSGVHFAHTRLSDNSKHSSCASTTLISMRSAQSLQWWTSMWHSKVEGSAGVSLLWRVRRSLSRGCMRLLQGRSPQGALRAPSPTLGAPVDEEEVELRLGVPVDCSRVTVQLLASPTPPAGGGSPPAGPPALPRGPSSVGRALAAAARFVMEKLAEVRADVAKARLDLLKGARSPRPKASLYCLRSV